MPEIMLDRDLTSAEAAFFRALGDETRLRILNLLKKHGRLNVSEICKNIEKEQGTISHHLACLRSCGLVTTRRKGKNIIYSLNGEDEIKTILDVAEKQVMDAVEGILKCEVIR